MENENGQIKPEEMEGATTCSQDQAVAAVLNGLKSIQAGVETTQPFAGQLQIEQGLEASSKHSR
jgi:hypothetical protein